jgi:hypothetical protein
MKLYDSFIVLLGILVQMNFRYFIKKSRFLWGRKDRVGGARSGSVRSGHGQGRRARFWARVGLVSCAYRGEFIMFKFENTSKT